MNSLREKYVNQSWLLYTGRLLLISFNFRLYRLKRLKYFHSNLKFYFILKIPSSWRDNVNFIKNSKSYTERKISNVLQRHIVIMGQVHILVFFFQIFLDNMQTVRWRYIKVRGKTTYFALDLQSLYVSGERYCIFLSVYKIQTFSPILAEFKNQTTQILSTLTYKELSIRLKIWISFFFRNIKNFIKSES